MQHLSTMRRAASSSCAAARPEPVDAAAYAPPERRHRVRGSLAKTAHRDELDTARRRRAADGQRAPELSRDGRQLNLRCPPASTPQCGLMPPPPLPRFFVTPTSPAGSRRTGGESGGSDIANARGGWSQKQATAQASLAQVSDEAERRIDLLQRVFCVRTSPIDRRRTANCMRAAARS